MPRGLKNWNFSQVQKFLKKNNFRHNHTEGSHYYFVGFQDNKVAQVCVPFHGSKSIKPRTMRSIILQSGISKEEWLG